MREREDRDERGVVTLRRPSVVAELVAFLAGLGVLGGIIFGLARVVVPVAGMPVLMLLAMIPMAAAINLLPYVVHSRIYRFDPDTRVVTQAQCICGWRTAAREVCPFGAVGKIMMTPASGDTSWTLEIWMGNAPVRLPGGRRRLFRQARRLAAVLGKREQTWNRYGTWT